MIDAVNSVAQNLGAAAVGKLVSPPPVQSISVQGVQSPATSNITATSEILHWVINHTQPISKGIRYFSEVDVTPNFPNPHVIDHGTSRTGFLHLPTFLNDGVTKQTYYLRSYAQYPGSDPQKPVVYGGLTNPLGIQMTGASAMTLLASPGSGTAAANGSQGGKGLGVDLVRSQSGPKRNTSA